MFRFNCLLILLMVAATSQSAIAEQPQLVRVERIWDRAPHNAFTDLLRHQDRWLCVFREGAAHVSPDGALRVIESSDGWEWQSRALITHDNADLRDAKLTVAPSGELMLSGAGAMHPPSSDTHRSMVWFSSDGSTWSQPQQVADPDHWLWRITWQQDTAFGVAYRTGKTKERYVRLYRSRDGHQFESWVETMFDRGYPNESSLVFAEDGRCWCLLRRDGKGDATAMLGESLPPYRDWQWKDLGVQVGGPQMIQLPDGRLVAAVRLYDGVRRTALCWVDPEAGRIEEFLTLPSGGDTSYAGLVWHDEHLWVSYYSGHESGQTGVTTSIYLAQVALR